MAEEAPAETGDAEDDHIGLPVIRPGRRIAEPLQVDIPDAPASCTWTRVRTARHRASGSVSTTPPDYVPKRRANVEPQ